MVIYLERLKIKQLSDLDFESTKLMFISGCPLFDVFELLIGSKGSIGEQSESWWTSRMQLKLSMSNEIPFTNFRFIFGVDVGVLKQKKLSTSLTFYIYETYSFSSKGLTRSAEFCLKVLNSLPASDFLTTCFSISTWNS